MYLIHFDAWTVKKDADTSSECSVNYLKLHPDCTVISLCHLSSNSSLLKITILLLLLTLPSWSSKTRGTPGAACSAIALVLLAIFVQRREAFQGFRVSMKKGPEYPIPFYRVKGWQASVSQPTPSKTIYRGKKGGFPEDVKIRNQMFASCKYFSSPWKGLLPCIVGEVQAQRMESNQHCEDASSPSSFPCSGHVLQPLGAFQWLLCSYVSASWSILSSHWNPAHATPPTYNLCFQLQMGTREEKGKIMGVRRWRSETQMKQKV